MATPDNNDAAAAGVLAAEEARRQAMLAGNTARLGELLADTLVYTHATGVRDSKQGYLQQLLSGALRYETLEFVAPDITLLGRVGLVSAVMQATVLRGDARRRVVSSYLAVWECTSSGWTLQAVQATTLPTTT